jgi:hypothetical protein
LRRELKKEEVQSQEDMVGSFIELRTHLIVALVNPAVSNDMTNETIALSGTACPL